MFLEIFRHLGNNFAGAGFSILFGSMFLEIFHIEYRNGLLVVFQYPLWIDVFGNHLAHHSKVFICAGFSILFGSMFLEMQSV